MVKELVEVRVAGFWHSGQGDRRRSIAASDPDVLSWAGVEQARPNAP